MGALAQVLALSWRDRGRLVGYSIVLPVLVGALRVAGYARTRALVERWSGWVSAAPGTRRDGEPSGGVRPAASVARIEDAQRVAWLADVAGRRGIVTATCLPQALLVYGVLRRLGAAPTIELGARVDGDAFGAHAWVALDGVALGRGAAGHAAFRAAA